VLTPGVILDLDDTLFLERDYVRSGLAAAGEHVTTTLGVRGFADVAIALFEDGVRGTTFNQALLRLGIEPTEQLVADLVGVYRRHAPAIGLLPDAARLIARLDPRYLGVVTDGPLDSQRAKAQAVGAPAWATLIVYTAELGPGYGKPHELAFSMHEARAGLAGDQLTYVADNPTKDFGGPKALGWTTVRIRRPGALHAALASGSDVDREVVSLDQLAQPR
jgi:putative hydrolase of the HAD superfamily